MWVPAQQMNGRRTTLHGHVAFRRRLSETLAGVACNTSSPPITIVVGPAGSGKSTALLEVQRSCDRVCVVRLNDDNVSLFGFVRGVADALAPHVRGPAQSFAALHERLGSVPEPVTAIARWLIAHLADAHLTLAIDRFERVASEARIVALIEAVAQERRGLRWILSTRRMGVLPLDSWMSRDLMAMPYELPPTTHRADMMLQFASLRPKHRDLVEKTIELPSLDLQLLNALGIDGAAETLRHIRGAHPELFEAGDALEYRYDLREACIERLRREDLPHYGQIVRATGALLEQQRRFEDALKLYIRTLQIEPLYRLLEAYGLEIWETVAPDTLDVALRLVPRETQPQSGIVLALRAAAASRAGRHDISETLYVNAMEISQGDVRSRIAYAYGCDMLRRNRNEAVDVLRPLAGERMTPAREAAVRSALAQAYCMRDDRERASEEAACALELCGSFDDRWTTALVCTRVAYVAFYAEGDFDQAAQLAQHGLSLAESCRAYVTAVGALSLLYNVSCEDDDPAQACAYLRQMAAHSEKIGNVAFASYALLAELEFQVEAFDLDAIAHAKKTLASFDVHYEEQATSEALLPSEALQLTWQGDFGAAYRLLEPSIARQQGEDFKALRTATVALYAAASDALELAASLTEEALHALNRLDMDGQKSIRARIFTALALSMLGQSEMADHLFDDIATGVAHYPRLCILANTAQLIHRLWNGDSVGADLIGVLADARQQRFGGLAAMLARLPMHIAVRERVASNARRATASYSKIVPLLERYHDVPLSL